MVEVEPWRRVVVVEVGNYAMLAVEESGGGGGRQLCGAVRKTELARVSRNEREISSRNNKEENPHVNPIVWDKIWTPRDYDYYRVFVMVYSDGIVIRTPVAG
ncbi:Autophagy-related protein 11 [Bienertia sinuspersici]